ALDVSPATLLLPGMPGADNPEASVETTGVTDPVRLVDLWNWLKAMPGPWQPPWISVPQPVYEGNALPAWEWHQFGGVLPTLSHEEAAQYLPTVPRGEAGQSHGND
ncbi:MAG: hypothetical protein WB967_23350, partial [Mycobacterium sp.]